MAAPARRKEQKEEEEAQRRSLIPTKCKGGPTTVWFFTFHILSVLQTGFLMSFLHLLFSSLALFTDATGRKGNACKLEEHLTSLYIYNSI